MTPISPRGSIVKGHERSGRRKDLTALPLSCCVVSGLFVDLSAPLSSSLKGAARIKDDKDDDDNDSHCLRRTESVKQCTGMQ